MFSFDYITKKGIQEQNPSRPQSLDRPYKVIIIGGWGSAKTNLFLNLINYHPNTEKSYLYSKDPYKAKYKFFINRCGGVGLKEYNFWIFELCRWYLWKY